jgi:hypothetical protein
MPWCRIGADRYTAQRFGANQFTGVSIYPDEATIE